jgi:hypothetical protein
MGFYIHGGLVIEKTALLAYRRLIGNCYAIPTSAPQVPSGWFLPFPYITEFAGLGKEAEWFNQNRSESEWRAKLGCPAQPDPEKAFSLEDLRFGALLSLFTHSGAVLIDDETHGGVLDHEDSAAFIGGRFQAAAGVNYLDHRSYHWNGHEYLTQPDTCQDPSSFCASLLHPSFGSFFLFDGYLPRSDDCYDAESQNKDPIDEHPIISSDWSDWFTNLQLELTF